MGRVVANWKEINRLECQLKISLTEVAKVAFWLRRIFIIVFIRYKNVEYNLISDKYDFRRPVRVVRDGEMIYLRQYAGTKKIRTVKISSRPSSMHQISNHLAAWGRWA